MRKRHSYFVLVEVEAGARAFGLLEKVGFADRTASEDAAVDVAGARPTDSDVVGLTAAS
jgi:hypothetical protein